MHAILINRVPVYVVVDLGHFTGYQRIYFLALAFSHFDSCSPLGLSFKQVSQLSVYQLLNPVLGLRFCMQSRLRQTSGTGAGHLSALFSDAGTLMFCLSDD